MIQLLCNYSYTFRPISFNMFRFWTGFLSILFCYNIEKTLAFDSLWLCIGELSNIHFHWFRTPMHSLMNIISLHLNSMETNLQACSQIWFVEPGQIIILCLWISWAILVSLTSVFTLKNALFVSCMLDRWNVGKSTVPIRIPQLYNC